MGHNKYKVFPFDILTNEMLIAEKEPIRLQGLVCEIILRVFRHIFTRLRLLEGKFTGFVSWKYIRFNLKFLTTDYPFQTISLLVNIKKKMHEESTCQAVNGESNRFPRRTYSYKVRIFDHGQSSAPYGSNRSGRQKQWPQTLPEKRKCCHLRPSTSASYWCWKKHQHVDSPCIPACMHPVIDLSKKKRKKIKMKTWV